MEYNVPNINEILSKSEKIYDPFYELVIIKEYDRLKKKELLIKKLKKVLPTCKYYEIDINNFIIIAYNNIITQLTNIIEKNNPDVYEKINLKYFHNTNKIKNSFYELVVNTYINTLSLSKLYKLDTDINTYGDLLNYTTTKIYDIICICYKYHTLKTFFII
jgi:hypothetical protein